MTTYWFARSAKLSRGFWGSRMHPLPVSLPGRLLLWIAIALMVAGGATAIVLGRQTPEQTGLLLLMWFAAVAVPTAFVMNWRCDPDRTLEDYASAPKTKHIKMDLA